MKFVLILGMFFVISCSKDNQQNSIVNKDVELASSQNLAILTNQGDTFDYGSMLATDSSIIKIFKYQNTGDVKSSEAPVASISGDSAYSLVLQSGCSSLLNVGSTCQVRVMFNPAGKTPGTYKTTLKLGSSPLLQQELTAIVTTPLQPGDVGYVAPPIFQGINSYNELAESISLLDMGSFFGNQSLTKIVIFKNEGTSTAPVNTAVVSNSADFSILNQCVNKRLAVGASCQVRFTFASKGKINGHIYISNVTFLGKSIPVNATVLTLEQALLASQSSSLYMIPNIIALDNGSEVTNIDLGILTQTDSISKTITFRNIGTGVSDIGSSTKSDSINFSYIDQCQNKSLLVDSSCSVRATINALGKSGPFSTTINFLGKSVIISGSISPDAVITYSPIYSSYGSCSAVNPCDGQGLQSRTIPWSAR